MDVRNITRAYNLLMLQCCRGVMKEQLETQPDYDGEIRDKPIAARQRIRVLAHDSTRGRYHYLVHLVIYKVGCREGHIFASGFFFACPRSD